MRYCSLQLQETIFLKMSLKPIETRADLVFLVDTFYARVRKHEVLGPVFNGKIDDWVSHLENITNFWETTIFLGKSYHGNPMRKHLELDKELDHSIKQEHFGHWLELWFDTIDLHFEGEKASLAKERARNMAHILFMRIFEQRPNN